MNRFSIKTAWIFTLAFFSLISLAFAQENNDEPFRFVFMTDIHVMPERNAVEGFKTAIEKVNRLKPDFVITGGDLVFDVLETSHERAVQLYDLYEKTCLDFNMPVYHTPGNHEVFGLYEKSGIDPDHEEYGKEMFKKRLGQGNTSLSFNHKGWHFILLDSIGSTPERRYIGEVEKDQLAWLKSDLEKVAPGTPIVLSVHIPLVSVWSQMRDGANAALPENCGITNSREVLELFKEHNLKLVLQGHMHIVEEIAYKKTRFITGGAVSGAWWRGANEGFPEGFVVLDVTNGEFTWNYETFGWKAETAKKN